MNASEKMKQYRLAHRYSLADMSRKSGASATLLKMLENGLVTHPKIARIVGSAYELTSDEIYELMPANYRPDDPDYDPEKYKEPDEVTGKNKKMDWFFAPSHKTEADIYIAEHQKKMRREHQKRGAY